MWLWRASLLAGLQAHVNLPMVSEPAHGKAVYLITDQCIGIAIIYSQLGRTMYINIGLKATFYPTIMLSCYLYLVKQIKITLITHHFVFDC